MHNIQKDYTEEGLVGFPLLCYSWVSALRHIVPVAWLDLGGSTMEF